MARKYIYSVNGKEMAIIKKSAEKFKKSGKKVVNLSYGYRSNAKTMPIAKFKKRR